jgi:hypothetical protein
MTRISKRTEMSVLQREWQGVLIRLGLSVGLLALALALASRFS